MSKQSTPRESTPRESTPRASTGRRGFRELAGLLLVIPLAAVVWLILSQAQSSGPEMAPEAGQPPDPAAELAEPEPRPARQRDLEPPHQHREQVLASAQSEFKPGDPSHAMEPERRRAYRQNDFIGQIDGAILVKDYQGIRRLNAEYRREYPDDDQMTREAYDLIADCLENKTPERVERAREFWETKRGSRARRDVRKICLE